MDESNYIEYEFDYNGEHYEMDDEGNVYGGSQTEEFNKILKILAEKYASPQSSPLPYFEEKYGIELIEVEPKDELEFAKRLLNRY